MAEDDGVKLFESDSEPDTPLGELARGETKATVPKIATKLQKKTITDYCLPRLVAPPQSTDNITRPPCEPSHSLNKSDDPITAAFEEMLLKFADDEEDKSATAGIAEFFDDESSRSAHQSVAAVAEPFSIEKLLIQLGLVTEIISSKKLMPRADNHKQVIAFKKLLEEKEMIDPRSAEYRKLANAYQHWIKLKVQTEKNRSNPMNSKSESRVFPANIINMRKSVDMRKFIDVDAVECDDEEEDGFEENENGEMVKAQTKKRVNNDAFAVMRSNIVGTVPDEEQPEIDEYDLEDSLIDDGDVEKMDEQEEKGEVLGDYEEDVIDDEAELKKAKLKIEKLQKKMARLQKNVSTKKRQKLATTTDDDGILIHD